MADRNAAWAASRIVLTSGALALLVIGTVALLFLAAAGARDAGTAARHSKDAPVAGERIERLVVDPGVDPREPSRTHDPTLRHTATERAHAAHAQLTGAERVRGAGVESVGGAGAERASRAGTERVGVGRVWGGGVAASARGAGGYARGVAVAAVVSGVTMLVLIGLLVVYLAKVTVRPVRRAVVLARKPADGDPADGDPAAWRHGISAGEGGVIGWRFNTMAVSSETGWDGLLRVASEQGALRRVATLVARGVSSSEVFDAVAAEVGHVLAADHTAIVRFEADDTAQVVGYWNDSRVPTVMPPLGGRWPIEAGSVTATLRATGRPTRMKHTERATSAIGSWAHAAGINCAVGCPVTLEGRTWGGMIIHWLEDEPPAGVTEARMREFVELVGTAIANAQSRSELLASRARVVAAADESRRRIERELHDGAQQRLVTLALKLRTVEATLVPPDGRRLREELGGLVHDLSSILRDVQEVSRGIIPPVLARSGLGPALRSLARHSAVPVVLAADDVGRLPEPVEVAVYYTVAEALKNVDRHAQASEARVGLVLEHRSVRLSVQDDGRGGAAMAGGSGLVGLKDRVEALGGTIEVVSPAGAGTSVVVEVPVDTADADPAP